MSGSDKASIVGEDQSPPDVAPVNSLDIKENGRSATSRTTRSKSLASDKPDVESSITNAGPDKDGQRKPGEDLKDDSEAETVLSSPVKRRELQRKANGTKDEADGASVSSEIHVNNEGFSSEHEERPLRNGSHQKNGQKSSVEGDSDSGRDEGARPNHKRDGSEDSAESDAESKDASGSPDSGREGSEEPPNDHSVPNPRKRKHRESSTGRKTNEPDSIKRQRRSSTDQRKSSDRSSEELSPPPRLRRHKRTVSGHTKEEGGDGAGTTAAGARARRAASHLPLRDQKMSKDGWESDSDSEVSHQQQTSRNTRSINRSVSTPGRPMARDHKRHVNKYGFTRLAEACESGDLEAVKEWRDKDHEQLEQREFAGNTPLQVASLNGHSDIVKYLLSQGCNPHCANTDKDTPLIDAVENGHSKVVQHLLDAGVDPMRQNMKGQQALDVITEDTGDGPEIRAMLRKAIENWKERGSGRPSQNDEEHESRPAGPRQGLHFMARTADNMLKLVANNDREGVKQFLDARVPVDNNIVAAAAKTGDIYLVNILLAEMSPKKARTRPERPMLAVLGTSHFEMVKTLTELEHFNPAWRSKSNGMTWHELAKFREGPHWKEEYELLQHLYNDTVANSRLSSSPVSKRENGIRRQKSPAHSKDSDEDMDDADSPDVAPAKRRLISRKDMRASASRKSPSTESSHPASSPEAVMKPAEEDDAKPRRKAGRPRTKSLSSHAPEIKTKRIKSGSSEGIALFQSAAPARKRKVDDTSSRSVAKSVQSSKSNETNDGDVKMTDVKIEEERKAELERKEAEEAARKEEEERVERELKEESDRREQRRQKLDSVPSALSRVLDMDNAEPVKVAEFSAKRFLPLQAIPGTLLELDGDRGEALWMPSYQAAGLLRGDAADILLNLAIQPDVASRSVVEGMQSQSLLADHRKQLLINIGSANLTCDNTELQIPASPDPAIKRAAIKAMRKSIWSESVKFLSMEPMRWLNLKDFLSVKAALQNEHASDYPHLQYLPALGFALHSCLNSSAFDSVKTESPKIGTPKDGLPHSPTTPVSVVDEQLRKSIGHGLKEGDGVCTDSSTGAVKGTTRVEIVID